MDASRLLCPLNEFYTVDGRPLPEVDAQEPDRIVDPYRHLLAHSDGLGMRLAAFHGERVARNLIQVRSTGETHSRRLRLVLAESSRPLAYAAIRVYMNLFGPAIRDEVAEGKRSLGAILKTYGVACAERPMAFFRVLTDETLNKALDLSDIQETYGRGIRLQDRARRTLAEAVEILAP
jgi:hypothetical protein